METKTPENSYKSFSDLFDDDWKRLELKRAEEDALWAKRTLEDPLREDWTIGFDPAIETEEKDEIFESNPIFEKATQLVGGCVPLLDPTILIGEGDDAQENHQTLLESLFFPHIILVDSFGQASPLSLYDLYAFEFPWEGLDIEHTVLMDRDMNILEGTPPAKFCPRAAAAVYLRSEGADISADLVAQGIAQVTTEWEGDSKLLMCLEYKGYNAEADRCLCDRLMEALDGKAVAEPCSEYDRDPDARCSVRLLISDTYEGKPNPWFAPLKRALQKKDTARIRGISALNVVMDDPIGFK